MPLVAIADLPRTTLSGRVSDLLGDLGPFESRSIAAPYGMAGLGANIEELPPGSTSSHRHWHEKVDEIVVMLEGTLTLVEDTGETPLAAGDIAVFPAGVENGHCLRNDSATPARFLVVSSQDAADRCHYTQADLIAEPDGSLRNRDGTIQAPATP